MNIPKIHEDKIWSAQDVQNLCIKHELYDAGDNEAFRKVLSYVEKKSPTTRNIYIVAKDILEHSSQFSSVDYIMYMLGRDVVRTYYDVAE